METSQSRCPMCGAGLSAAADYCDECGERVSERALLEIQFEQDRRFVEARYKRNLKVLEWLLLAFGHLTFVVSIFIMIAFAQAGFAGPMFLIGLIACVAGSLWIVSGYACNSQRRWGILTALIVSYLILGGSLVYWNLTGIAVSLVLSIQAHRVLRFSHQVIAANFDSEQKLSS